jgi:hypothetical protein
VLCSGKGVSVGVDSWCRFRDLVRIALFKLTTRRRSFKCLYPNNLLLTKRKRLVWHVQNVEQRKLYNLRIKSFFLFTW